MKPTALQMLPWPPETGRHWRQILIPSTLVRSQSPSITNDTWPRIQHTTEHRVLQTELQLLSKELGQCYDSLCRKHVFARTFIVLQLLHVIRRCNKQEVHHLRNELFVLEPALFYYLEYLADANICRNHTGYIARLEI